MSNQTLILSKMENCLEDQTPKYTLNTNNSKILVNNLIGKTICIKHTGNIYCVSCQKHIKKTFQQGFCFTCFRNSPLASPCIIHPEKCQGHLGKGRDIDWEQKYHVQEHIVYLSFTDDVKVGVTRQTNAITRWIDQGAIFATPIAKTPNRYLAGKIEVLLKQIMKDKTYWKNMLLHTYSQEETQHIIHKRQMCFDTLRQGEYISYTCEKDIQHIAYPITQNISSVTSLSFKKQDSIEGTLIGIKGQYLIFDTLKVFNVRSHTGYEISILTD